MNVYKKLINNSLIFVIGDLGSKLIILFLVPLYTFYLTPTEFGTVDLMRITVTLLIPLFTLSIIDSILRYVMDKNIDKQSVLVNAAMISMLGILVMILSYPLIIILLPFDEYILFFYLLIIAQTLNTLLAQYTRSIGLIKIFAANGIITAFLLLIGNVIFLIVLETSIIGFLSAYILSYLFSSIVLFFAADIKNNFSFKKIDFMLMKSMLIFSIPLMPNTLMWWIMSFSDRYMLTYFLGITATGFYAVAIKVPSIISIINSVFFQAWQMSAIEEADSERKSAFYTNIFNVFSLIMLVATSFILFILKPLMNIIVSDVFFESWKYVPFLLLAVVFSSFSSFLGTNYIVSKKTSGVIKTSLIGAAVNILGNLILIPLIGINGAAISTMISFAIVWLLRIKDTKNFVEIRINKLKLFFTFGVIFLQIFTLYNIVNLEIFYHIIFVIIIIIINFKEILIFIKRIIILFQNRNMT